MNAITHGAFAVTVGVVEFGALHENGEDAREFFDAVIDGLDPDTDLDFLLARGVAAAMWRHRRVLTYEALGLTQPHDQATVYAFQRRDGTVDAINDLEQFAFRELRRERLENLAACLALHPSLRTHEWWDCDRTGPYDDLTIRAFIAHWTSTVWPSVAAALNWLRSELDEHEDRLDTAQFTQITELVRDLVTGESQERIRRADAYASREIDRALARYRHNRDRPKTLESRNEPTDA